MVLRGVMCNTIFRSGATSFRARLTLDFGGLISILGSKTILADVAVKCGYQTLVTTEMDIQHFNYKLYSLKCHQVTETVNLLGIQ